MTKGAFQLAGGTRNLKCDAEFAVTLMPRDQPTYLIYVDYRDFIKFQRKFNDITSKIAK